MFRPVIFHSSRVKNQSLMVSRAKIEFYTRRLKINDLGNILSHSKQTLSLNERPKLIETLYSRLPKSSAFC